MLFKGTAMQVMRVPVRSLLGGGNLSSAERLLTIYYHKNNKEHEGAQPTVVYVPGFMSLGRATKSRFMEAHCHTRGWDYVCYDPEGVVDTETDKEKMALEGFETLKFSHW